MTSSEFVIWLKGFTEGVHEFNITPKQWDLLKEKLSQVNDNSNGTTTITHATGSTTGSNVIYTINGAPNWYSSNKTNWYPSNIKENDSTDK